LKSAESIEAQDQAKRLAYQRLAFWGDGKTIAALVESLEQK